MKNWNYDLYLDYLDNLTELTNLDSSFSEVNKEK